MTHFSARLRICISGWLAAWQLLAAPHLAQAAEEADPAANVDSAAQSASSISANYGRWNSAVTLVYDPDAAPQLFSDSNTVLAALQEAAGRWERVSGVQFNIPAADSDVPADSGSPGARYDGLVRVSWEALGGAAGRAGPVQTGYDAALGYRPYIDGKVELSAAASTWDSTDALVTVLVHELGHLLGLGHSAQPDSVMYTDPDNHLQYPREADIRTMQALYGEPAPPIDPAEPLPEWVFEPPPQASAMATQYLFKPNFSVDSGAFFTLDGRASTPVSGITDATADSEFVMLNSGGIGAADSPALTVEVTLVVTDPSGYVYKRRPWDLSCPANTACQAAISIATTAVIKSLAGNWKVYVIDQGSDSTLLAMTLPVTTQGAGDAAP